MRIVPFRGMGNSFLLSGGKFFPLLWCHPAWLTRYHV
uniref:Uncharacterized protein n=1 Tax=Picea glauca TaxID=3330 RepID=A0A124GN27_PICGL|nr:hypothetical protein ABT39_MTgene5679 [Picea glauca]